MPNNIIEELKWRGLIKQYTSEERIEQAQMTHSGVYCGFDPTADSLHVGHLIPITLLVRFQNFGFKPIGLIGGGTGMIGDPSFKSQERVLQTDEQVKRNAMAIRKQLKSIIPNVTLLDNYEWLHKLSLLDFLREVGKDFTIGYLLNKESIATRIETGLSVTEFMYTILQAYDFQQLYLNNDCHVQIGGSDQWGNITSGTDLISKTVGSDKTMACGLTINLLTKKDGKKFGKTESSAIWLDPKKTSPYEFYQFWFNQDDEDAQKMLKFFSFKNEHEINNLILKAQKEPKLRLVQRELAEELTLFVHHQEGLKQAQNVTKAFFIGELNNLSFSELKVLFNSIPHGIIEENTTLIDALVESNAASSKREAREFLQANAITINGIVYQDEALKLSKKLEIADGIIIIKRGKKKFFGLKIK